MGALCPPSNDLITWIHAIVEIEGNYARHKWDLGWSVSPAHSVCVASRAEILDSFSCSSIHRCCEVRCFQACCCFASLHHIAQSLCFVFDASKPSAKDISLQSRNHYHKQ